MSSAQITLIVLAVMVALFLTQPIPLAVTALSGALALYAFGVIPLAEAFAGFSNPTILLFGGMFVVGAAVFHTGLAEVVGETIVRVTGKSEARLMAAVMVLAGALSTVASNTGTTATLMPIVISICMAAGLPASRQLMPLAFASGFGGFSAMIGTPPNMIVTAALREAGLRPFGFFEFAWLGIPMALAGMLYMLFVGKRLLPDACALPAPGGAGDGSRVPVSKKVRRRQWTSGLILLGVVAAMACNHPRLPLEAVAVGGGLLCVITGCLSEKEAFASIEWEIVFLFAGMLSVAKALETTGAGRSVAGAALSLMGGHPHPLVVLASLFLLAILLGTFMSNSACAALLAPIGLSLAEGLGMSPHALLMTIAAATSCSFLTPVGTPPNTMVLAPGGYRFSDYLKVGSGLTLVCFLISILVIPLKWGFLR